MGRVTAQREEWPRGRRAVLPSRGPWTGWSNGQEEPDGAQHGDAPSAAPAEEQPPAPGRAAALWKGPGVPTDTKLPVILRRWLITVAWAGRGRLGLKEVTLPLSSALVRPQWACCAQCWAPQYTRDVDILGRAKGRTDADGAGRGSREARRSERGVTGPERRRLRGDVTTT